MNTKRIFIIRRTLFPILIGLITIFNIANSQEKASLTPADQKKLQKADKDSEKATKLFQEADKMYGDVIKRSADLTLEESDKLNNKAVVKQIEAEKIESGANRARYDVYAARVELFWLRYTGDIDLMAYARSLDNSAKSDYTAALELLREFETTSDNLMKLSKIHDGNEMLVKAIEKMKQAFELCANPPSQETAPAYTTPPAQEPVAIVEPEPAVTPITAEPEPTPTVEEMPTQVVEESPAESRYVPSETPTPVAEEKPEPMYEPSPSVSPAYESPVPAQTYEEEKPAPATKVITYNDFGSGSFKVQIAASRVPLNAEQLQEIYNGNEQLSETIINEWYKYSIGPFDTYEMAAQFRDACGVKGAFVVRP